MLMTSLLQRVAITFLIVATTCAPIFAQDTAATSREQLDKLLAAYKAYGLPLPPANAKLVRYLACREYVDNGVRHSAKYGLAFLLKAETKGAEFDLLIGVRRESGSLHEKYEIVEPKLSVLGRTDPNWVDLQTAIQFHARGWDELAQPIVAHWSKDSNTTPMIRLTIDAWEHWTRDLCSPEVNWSKLAPQLQIILDREPKAFEPHHRHLLRSMQLALQPSNAKPGSMDALVDRLIDAPMETGAMFTYKDDPRYLKVALHGFALVPTLIAHLDDERLTRTRRNGFNNFHSWQYRVQHIVSDLLQDLAGEDLGKDWLRRQQGYVIDKADAEAWWKETQTIGEEAYFVRNVLGASTEAMLPNTLMLQVIAKKYPKHLDSVYRKMLAERPNMIGGSLADAVVESALPKERQREILLTVAAAKNLDHRCDALWKLKDIDSTQFNAIIVLTLAELGKSPMGHNSRYAHLVQETTNAMIWTALLKAAKNAEPGARLEYLDTMRNYEDRMAVKNQQLRFLSKFLEDSEKGVYGWNGFAFMEVRNMAAWKIALILEMDSQPESRWTDAQWADLRAKVKMALERAGIK